MTKPKRRNPVAVASRQRKAGPHDVGQARGEEERAAIAEGLGDHRCSHCHEPVCCLSALDAERADVERICELSAEIDRWRAKAHALGDALVAAHAAEVELRATVQDAASAADAISDAPLEEMEWRIHDLADALRAALAGPERRQSDADADESTP